MPRTKLVLKLIDDEKKRKTTFKNRLKGLVKKVKQFETLCDVDVFLICIAGAGGEVVTTWPADRAAVERLIDRLRATPPAKIREVHTTETFLQDDLGKQRRNLIKARAAGELPSWDSSLDKLDADGLSNLYDALSEKLERAHRRIAALGGGGGVALPEIGFEFPFAGFASSSSNTGLTQFYYPLHDVTLPVTHMPPPLCLTYDQMPPPPAIAAAPFEFMNGNAYATNYIEHGGEATTTAGFLDDHCQGFVAGEGYNGDVLGHGFAVAGAGYDLDLECCMMNSDVWPMMNTIENPMCSNFQGGFQI
uniref:MADS-box domain-containing protein n=1 Tax=Leersia perrieri TaxID=77586 RepID=A0A0D9XAE2_9ORYZ